MINCLSMTSLKTVSHFLLVMTDQQRLYFDEIFTRYDNALSVCSDCYKHSLSMVTIYTPSIELIIYHLVYAAISN